MVINATGYENDWSTGTRYTLEDQAGNCFMWWSTSSFTLEQGQSYNLAFTVTNHTEFKARKQTVINRAKIAVEKKARKPRTEAAQRIIL